MLSHWMLVISAALGVGTVPLVSLLKGEHWSTEIKFALALVITAVAATVQVGVAGHLNHISQFVAAWATVIASGQAFYQTWFGGSTFETLLNKIGPIARRVDTVVTEVAPVLNVAVKDNPKATAAIADAVSAVAEVTPKK